MSPFGAEDVRPRATKRLPQVKFENPASIMFQRVEQGDLRVSAASEDPVRVEVELHVLGLGVSEHMVELAPALT